MVFCHRRRRRRPRSGDECNAALGPLTATPKTSNRGKATSSACAGISHIARERGGEEEQEEEEEQEQEEEEEQEEGAEMRKADS